MIQFILGMVCGAIVLMFAFDFYISHLCKKELFDYIADEYGKGDK